MVTFFELPFIEFTINLLITKKKEIETKIALNCRLKIENILSKLRAFSGSRLIYTVLQSLTHSKRARFEIIRCLKSIGKSICQFVNLSVCLSVSLSLRSIYSSASLPVSQSICCSVDLLGYVSR